jgi:protein-tyrosine sulfotransferase
MKLLHLKLKMFNKLRRITRLLMYYFFLILLVYWLINYTVINRIKLPDRMVAKNFNKRKNVTQKLIIKNTLDIIREQEYIELVKKSKFLFIGGFPKSGTTLLRAIMDVHDSISCGPDPHYLPNFLNQFSYLNEDFIYDDVNRMFIYYVLKNHFNSVELGRNITQIPKKISKNNTILCLKEPSLIFHFKYLNQLFPQSKIIYLVRDGRDVAFSIIESLNLSKNNENFMTVLKLWNDMNKIAFEQCNLIGSYNCIILKYEDLVEQRVKPLRTILNALGLKYIRELTRHESYINRRIFLEINDRVGKKVMKKLNLDSVKKWIGNIYYDKIFVNNTIDMLNKLGYNINFNDKLDGVNNHNHVSNNSYIISYEKIKNILF